MERTDVSRYIIDILSKENFSHVKVKENIFFHELDIDSFTFVKITIMIEEKYNIKFDLEMNVLSNFRQVSNLVDYTYSLISNLKK